MTTTTQTQTQTQTHTFLTRAATFAAILDAADGRWDAPTPCDGWTVRDVLVHVVETERDFLDKHDLSPGSAPDMTDPVSAWRTHVTGIADVLARDGVAERAYDGYFGPTTVAATMADFYGWDLVIHGSDIARATDQSWSISEAEADALHAVADGWGDALHSEGVCSAPIAVPDDASPTDRLLGRLGRDPGWTPAPRS